MNFFDLISDPNFGVKFVQKKSGGTVDCNDLLLPVPQPAAAQPVAPSAVTHCALSSQQWSRPRVRVWCLLMSQVTELSSPA